MVSETVEQLWATQRREITTKIEQHGQCVQVVYPTPVDPPGTLPFMYTIGNYHLGLPELLVVGTDKEVIAGVLNRLGKLQRDRGKGLADEEIVSVGGKFPVRVVDAGEIGRTKYATFVGIFYGTQGYAVRQVLLPDTQGRWPDQPGCDRPYCEQPVLSALGRSRH